MYENELRGGGAVQAHPAHDWGNTAKIAMATEERSPRASEQIANDLDRAVGRIHSAIDFTRKVADMHLGGRPETSGTQKDAPPRSGMMGALQDRADAIHASLGVLENELARLSKI